MTNTPNTYTIGETVEEVQTNLVNYIKESESLFDMLTDLELDGGYDHIDLKGLHSDGKKQLDIIDTIYDDTALFIRITAKVNGNRRYKITVETSIGNPFDVFTTELIEFVHEFPHY